MPPISSSTAVLTKRGRSPTSVSTIDGKVELNPNIKEVGNNKCINNNKSVNNNISDDKLLNIDKFCSNLLCVSSCAFLIPGIYAYNHSYWLYAIVSTLATILSINYWRDVKDGWRRRIDFMMAKTCFFVYFSSGFYYVRDLNLFLIGICGCILFLFAFHKSKSLYDQNNSTWSFYHAFFHCCSSAIQLLVLKSVENI